MRKLKKGDPVIVIAGKYKGTVSEVMRVKDDKVRVKGVNVVKKAVKGQGFIEKVLPIHISNIMYFYKDKNKPSRVGIKVVDGKKKRYLKKFDVIID